jgi:hypothetical protein
MTAPYPKRFGVLQNPAVAAEIARLDATRDCQRIAHLLAAYEFGWDFMRATELALFYTYGSASVSRLLDGTGEFRQHGQKRYDDTRLLMAHLIHDGYDGEVGRRALARVNTSHGHYRIPNDDFLFVLWTFIHFPIRWTDEVGPRRLSAHEREGWFRFWVGVGERMNLRDIPPSLAAFDAWVDTYQAREFRPCAASARVAADTLHIIEAWLPAPLRASVGPVVYSFFDDDPAFLAAIGVKAPPPWLRPARRRALRAAAVARRTLALGDYPVTPDSGPNRSYGKGDYAIEELRPHKLKAREEG